MRSAHEVPCTSVIHSAQKPFLFQRVVINPIKAVLRTGMLRFVNVLPRWGAAVPACVGRLRPYGGGSRKFNFEIPFVLMPHIFLPPISRATPRPRRRHNLAAHSTQIHSRRLLVSHLDPHSLCRPDHAKRCYIRAWFGVFFDVSLAFSAPRFLFICDNKPLHAKTFRAMAVHHLRGTQIPFPH